jgi:uncharacterized protein
LILYLDTSLLVAALTSESATAGVQQWLGEQSPESLAISDWVVTEFSSALSLKLRTGQLSGAQCAGALAAFARLCRESLDVLLISRDDFRRAAGLTEHGALGLRAGDALHLAICADRGATLCTLDQKLAACGEALGIGTTVP